MSFSPTPQPGALAAFGAPQVAAPAGAGMLRVQFLILFLLLTVLAIPGIWFILPSVYIQIVGHHTQGRVSVVADCGSDDDDDTNTNQAIILFRNDQGQLFEIPPNDTCTNFMNDGDSLTVWYLPNNPSSTFVLSGIAAFFYVFGGIWLVGTVIALFFFARITLRLLKASARLGEFGRLWRLALVCLVVLALLLGAVKLFPAGLASGPTSNYHLGSTVSVDGRWAVTVQGGHPSQVGLDFAPKDGTTCVELDITVRNLTNQTLSFEEDQFALYNAQVQAITPTCSVDSGELSAANVKPGQTMSGVIVYEVPLNQRLVYLAFQPDPDNATNVARSFWKIALTSAGPNHQPGETVSVDTLWQATLKSVQTNPATIIASPEPNSTCLALDVTLHNISGVSLDANSDQFSLYDQQGLAVRFPCVLNAPDFSGRVAPGSTAEAVLGFDVPMGETQFRLAFQANDCTENCQQAVWDIRVGG